MESAPEDKEQYREKLTGLQWKVAFEQGTEMPFQNEYFNNKEPGIYKSIASGVILFSSKDKFDSGTGWPSFTKPVADAPVKETTDMSLGVKRVEVSVETDGVHLGHVFEDGPQESGGCRYCINSASLQFVPEEKMTQEEKTKFGF